MRRSSGTGAVDRTRYGSTRTSIKSFYTHHAQMLSKAAVIYDAQAINTHIVHKRQKLINNTTPRPRTRPRRTGWRKCAPVCLGAIGRVALRSV